MVVAHNLMATYTANMMGSTNKAVKKNTEKLSSGYQINRAADDAAGLSISEKMRNQIRNLNQSTKNVEDGISVCQTADGALGEISSIIHRMEELAVHAANDVLTEDDRDACEKEMQELKGEIDKVGHDTMFNGIPLFRGQDIEVGPAGTTMSDVTPGMLELGYNNFKLSNSAPIDPNTPGNYLNLGVSGTSAAGVEGATWKLVYGSGGTSHPSVRLKWTDPATGAEHQQVLKLEDADPVNDSFYYDESDDTYYRDFRLFRTSTTVIDADGNEKHAGMSLRVNQSVSLVDNGGDDKYYLLGYNVSVSSNNEDYKVSYEFMYNCDSAYNNNDRCEGYYIDGARVTQATVFTTDDSLKDASNPNIKNSIPTDFSICNLESALGFTETVGYSGETPDTIALGHWTEVDQWSYYDNLKSNLGDNLVGRDLAFSYIWNEDVGGINGTRSFTYFIKQGIASTQTDPNVKDLAVKYDDRRLTRHESTMPMWIQSGANKGEDLKLEFEEVNCETIGVYDMSCRDRDHAVRALDQVKVALKRTNEHRSKIGAKQNRLEHTRDGNMNYSENLTQAESLIRDTNMATEMTSFSKNNILMQATQSMLTQANNSNQGVLSLLGA